MMALSTAAYGQLVKCVSKDGKVEYARDCPPGTTEQRVRAPGSAPAGTASPPPAQKSLAERDADFKKRQIEQQEAQQKDAKAAAEAQQRQSACNDARAYLKTLEEGVRVARVDPKTGERIYLEDSERATEMARARAQINDRCK
jgi:hypothetical protein